eukprot:TRINITY_DN3151_c0_g2_i1.p1 TRINITY_DN3151_c0_g2~~TRINITY_DN3151_c0_g2_i1.p1  ORF type:complete len:326 (+),score=80.01 TRINITY_DN3151_c0_g2_i1:86-1063(+)
MTNNKPRWINDWDSHHLPSLKNLKIGCYGVNNKNRVSTTFFQSKLNSLDSIPDFLSSMFNDEAFKSIFDIYSHYNSIPGRLKTTTLPKDFDFNNISSNSFDSINLNFHCCSLNLYPKEDSIPFQEEQYNLMLQGYLFGEDVSKNNVINKKLFPLVGFFHSSDNISGHGDLKDNYFHYNEQESCPLTFNSLIPIDQHVHYVSEVLNLDGFDVDLSDWFFGSNQGSFKFNIQNNSLQHFEFTFLLCFNLENKSILITFILFINENSNFFHLLNQSNHLNNNNNDNQDPIDDKSIINSLINHLQHKESLNSKDSTLLNHLTSLEPFIS